MHPLSKAAMRLATVVGAAAIALTALTQTAAAQTPSQQGRDKGQYIPTIWVDPDGCEHWVMDDGVEGYMTPHVTRQGIPVCRRGNVCGVMNTDQFFATDSHRISKHGQQRLMQFFQSANATSYIITGHTDSRASDAYNMRLSLNRANAVARVAQASGARIADVRGYGERLPVASNGSAAGMAKNRRVEIICIR
ncbi:MAG: OmpA family protein [Pseudomonadota bacterium]